MTSPNACSKWIQLSSLSESSPHYVFNTNPNEFIVVHKRRTSFIGMVHDYCLKSYKYSVETDVFNACIEHDNQVNRNAYIGNVTFNKKDQMLFV
eukprot:52345_1